MVKVILWALMSLLIVACATNQPERTVEQYRQACARGQAWACSVLGAHYERGDGVERNDRRAVALFRRSCEGGAPVGCSNLGYMYLRGRGVRQDDQKAVEYGQVLHSRL